MACMADRDHDTCAAAIRTVTVHSQYKYTFSNGLRRLHHVMQTFAKGPKDRGFGSCASSHSRGTTVQPVHCSPAELFFLDRMKSPIKLDSFHYCECVAQAASCGGRMILCSLSATFVVFGVELNASCPRNLKEYEVT